MAQPTDMANPSDQDLPWDARPDTYWDGHGLIKGDHTWTRGEAPIFLGVVGEYLPSLEDGEVEIVLIKLQSTTGDLCSLRARRDGKGITYRMVDEYEQEVVLDPPQSTQPLSLAELANLLWSFSWDDEPFIRGTWEQDLDQGTEMEEIRRFMSLESEFYNNIQAWYDGRFDDWRAHR